jgi:AcrR family transcriptional regulator
VTAATSTRAREAVAAGRRLLEEEGTAALTMRRLAERLGIRAPSLYKHLPDKAALEAAIIATGLEEAAEAFVAATEGADEPLPALAAAYRGFALAHPHLYRLMNNGPLPRQHLPPGLEDRTAAPVLPVAGSQARALWAFAHGIVMLELDHRFPPDADLDRAWQAGIAAFQPA